MDDNLIESGFAPVHKGQLYYEIAGSGLPILFIHAGVADHSMWDAQLNFFSQYYQVIRFDMRGFGKSRTETTEFSNRQDILDLLEYLGVKKAVLVGISRGGQIAIDFTLEHPEKVSALVAVAAGISGYDFQPGESPEAKHEDEIFSRMDELWEKRDFDELADLETHVWVDGPSQPEGRATSPIRNYIHHTILANYTRKDGEATAQPLNPPAAKRLAEIHVPVLILAGEYDTLGTLAMAETMEKEIPGAQKIIFGNTAHLIPLEKPDEFNEVVLHFLNDVT